MKIGLIHLDGKMPNVALMKLAAFHRDRGDEVTVIDMTSFQFDRTYASKVFVGGSGFDLKSELPPGIEALVPDYDKFKLDYSIGFTSRGCIRDCGFCIVREKEGAIRECSFDWIQHHNVLLLDNNFLASPKWKEKLQYFIRRKSKVCFTQGLDIRLVNDENAVLLSQVKYYDSHFRRRRLYFAFDDLKLEEIVIKGIKKLVQHGIKPHHLLFYILVAYNTTLEQDMHRFEVLRKLGVLPFVMIYNNRKDVPLQRHFSRWVNKRYYRVTSWENYTRKDKVA